jgi:soluble lytic murein transglycosylase-like protein
MNSTNLISASKAWTSTGWTRLHQATFLSLIWLIPCALRAETKTLVAAGTITVSHEKGRPVFSNDGAPASATKSLLEKALPLDNGVVRGTRSRDVSEYLTPQPRFMYWSNTEHRYKPVPHATPMAMKAAKSAAAEVDGYVSSNGSASLIGSAATPREVDDAIEQAARRHNVDVNLVRALIRVESNFNSKAVSRKGAMGLMQLMPSTARQLNVTNPFDPDQNVDAGVRHLKKLLQDFNGNVKLSLAAYNAGAGAVHRNAGIPNYAETRNYVSRITSLYNSGDTSPFRSMIGAHYEPMRISRDSMGVLTVTNTD